MNMHSYICYDHVWPLERKQAMSVSEESQFTGLSTLAVHDSPKIKPTCRRKEEATSTSSFCRETAQNSPWFQILPWIRRPGIFFVSLSGNVIYWGYYGYKCFLWVMTTLITIISPIFTHWLYMVVTCLHFHLHFHTWEKGGTWLRYD